VQGLDQWGSSGKYFGLVNGKLCFDSWNIATITGDTPVNDGQWHHVAVTFTDSSNAISLYIDGQLDRSSTIALGADDPSHMIKLGTDFLGDMAEVQFWDVARSQEDIAASRFSALQGDEANLAGYWNFESGTADLTGNHVDGSLAGNSMPQSITSTAPISGGLLTGGDGADILTGASGNDIIHAAAGADFVAGQGGNDRIGISGTSFASLDGGTGTDTLVWEDPHDATVDLTHLADIVHGFEAVDLTANGTQTLILDAQHLLSMTDGTNALTGTADTLVIMGAGDSVQLTGGTWTAGATNAQITPNDGHSYSVYTDSSTNAQVYVDNTVSVTHT
jgi:hypothetical protein